MTSNEAEDNCPPGMMLKDGDCVPKNNDETKKSEQDSNAGTVSDVGTPTPDEANPTPIPATDHECPPGTTWRDGKCEPSGDDAGQAGGGGTGAPDVPGKEAWMQWFEKLMASHTAYNNQRLELFKNSQQKMLESLSGKLGLGKISKETASFGNAKHEVSSMVDNSGYQSVYAETVEKPAKFLEAAAKQTTQESYMSWTINPQAYLESLKHGFLNYSWPDQPHQNVIDGSAKAEGFTITAGDMPQIFSKQVYLIPGGRMKVPIRQFLDTQIIQDADRFNWYKVNGFDFDDTTAEGTEPTNEDQTITKIQAVPTITRAVQTVNYADIENAPFDLVEAFNRAAALGAIDAEAKEVLDTTYNALASSPNTVDTFQWIRGDTGADVTTDDIGGLEGLKPAGIYAAKRAIDNKGGDSSPGNIVAFLNPESIESLVNETFPDFFTGQQGNPLHSTALGLLENRFGIDIVMTNRPAKVDNATNPDTSRDILCMKGSLGLAVAADLQIEAQRRPELSAIKVGARHRIKGAIIDESMTVRMSNAIQEIPGP